MSSNNIVTEEKLTEFYEDIKPYLGCPAYVTQEGDAEYYSTDEKVVGRWIDGKPLYQKTISLDWTTAPSGNVDIYVDDVLQNTSPIDGIRVYGSYTIVSDANRLEINQPFMSSGVSYYVVCQYISSSGYAKNKISISHNIHPSWYPVHVDIIAQYTKTTDSASTTIEQKPTHYSTDEQVVGTWIDGKPIYQKTFTGTTSATTSSDSVAGIISNFDTLVDSTGTIFLSGTWGVNQHSLPYNNVAEYYVDDSNQVIIHKQNEIANSKQYMVTLQYTKFTD